jgi:hypothetical protein
LHVEVSLLTADPDRFKDALSYIERDARPLVEDQPGSRGASLIANDELAVAVASWFWVSGDAMRESEKTVSAIYSEEVKRGAGTVSVEHFQVASYVQVKRPQAGAGVRLTRMDTQPPRIDEAITAYEDVALPWLTESEGFVGAGLYVHRRTGRSILETIWLDAQALAASRKAATAIRVDMVSATESEIRAVEEYRLVFNTVRSA